MSIYLFPFSAITRSIAKSEPSTLVCSVMVYPLSSKFSTSSALAGTFYTGSELLILLLVPQPTIVTTSVKPKRPAIFLRVCFIFLPPFIDGPIIAVHCNSFIRIRLIFIPKVSIPFLILALSRIIPDEKKKVPTGFHIPAGTSITLVLHN